MELDLFTFLTHSWEWNAGYGYGLNYELLLGGCWNSFGWKWVASFDFDEGSFDFCVTILKEEKEVIF